MTRKSRSRTVDALAGEGRRQKRTSRQLANEPLHTRRNARLAVRTFLHDCVGRMLSYLRNRLFVKTATCSVRLLSRQMGSRGIEENAAATAAERSKSSPPTGNKRTVRQRQVQRQLPDETVRLTPATVPQAFSGVTEAVYQAEFAPFTKTVKDLRRVEAELLPGRLLKQIIAEDLGYGFRSFVRLMFSPPVFDTCSPHKPLLHAHTGKGCFSPPSLSR